jgi:transcription initiation factor TFIIIB Brf1 subunit/transcription initiation factor TFIIB
MSPDASERATRDEQREAIPAAWRAGTHVHRAATELFEDPTDRSVVLERGFEIALQAEQADEITASPMAIGAAATYVAAFVEGYDRSQHAVANAAGVSLMTVRNHYRAVAEEVGADV